MRSVELEIADISLVTWNGRGLILSRSWMDHGHVDKQKKKSLMMKLARDYDVTHLQEVRGSLTQMNHFFNRFKSTHWMIFNPHTHDGNGGPASMYKK